VTESRNPADRPRVGDVVEFLRREGLLDGPPPTVRNAGVIVGSVRPDQDAQGDSLSWISGRVAREEPARVEGFRGALLIVGSASPASPAPLASCRSPKLAFSRAVHHFFPDLVEMEWPASGQPHGKSSFIAPSARIAIGAVIGAGCHIGEAVVIGPNSVLANTTVEPGTSIGANCTIGLPGYGYERDEDGVPFRFPHIGQVRIGRNVEIGSNTCIDRGALGDTVIGDDCKIDNLVHIAHNVQLGRNCLVIANAMVAGSVRVGDGAWVAPSASILNQLTIGEGAVIGMGATVIKPVAAGVTVAGNPARELPRKT